MYSVGAMKDIFAGLLVLVAISEDGVLGEHRIKMEKGYNLQERPASEEEGGPLLIRLVGQKCHHYSAVLHLKELARI